MSLSKDQIFLNITKEYSKFSKCQFTKVGCIAINENDRIVATAVNGTIPNQQNCCDHHFHHREDHIEFTRENEIHAELNLILEIARSQIHFEFLTIYITISPCFECLKVLLGLGKIKRIVYGEKYHRTTEEELERMKQKCFESKVLFQLLNQG